MKKNLWIALVFSALAGNVSLVADAGMDTQIEAKAVALSSDEQAFAAKLNDQNRKTFTSKLTVDQRKAAMVAVKNGANADEAVQRMLAAREIKEGNFVASSDEVENAAEISEGTQQ